MPRGRQGAPSSNEINWTLVSVFLLGLASIVCVGLIAIQPKERTLITVQHRYDTLEVEPGDNIVISKTDQSYGAVLQVLPGPQAGTIDGLANKNRNGDVIISPSGLDYQVVSDAYGPLGELVDSGNGKFRFDVYVDTDHDWSVMIVPGPSIP